jgi:hypothetical protein
MAGTEPGDRATPPAAQSARRLATPPSARYAEARGAGGPAPTGQPATDAPRSALTGPLMRAVLVAVAGAGALLVVGAILASTAGLLFVAGITGGAIGLVLARAAVPRSDARPLARRTVAWLAVGLAIAAVAIGAIATWFFARGEGGTLGLLDYLLETFGPFVPGEALVAAVAAAWGAHAGPVQA